MVPTKFPSRSRSSSRPSYVSQIGLRSRPLIQRIHNPRRIPGLCPFLPFSINSGELRADTSSTSGSPRTWLDHSLDHKGRRVLVRAQFVWLDNSLVSFRPVGKRRVLVRTIVALLGPFPSSGILWSSQRSSPHISTRQSSESI